MRSVVEIPESDEAYRTWIYAHPSGYVVNTYPDPTTCEPIIHRAMCDTITPTPDVKWTTGDWIKVCAERRYELDAWARERGSRLKACAFCDP
jgi:hypothetical protein